MNRNTLEMLNRLTGAGITLPDASALRRISMTLHRWHELECGDGNDYGSWAIVHDDNGAPYLEWHHYLHGKGKDYVTHTRIPDREKGARKRLDKIMARYPDFVAYVQTDPRGCALYLVPRDVIGNDDISCVYTRGIAVFK